MAKWQITWGSLLVGLMAGVLACGDAATGDSVTKATETVRGLVQEMKTRSLLELESLTLIDENGARLTFEARSGQVEGFTPSHIRDHMVQGQPVTVTFHRENGVLVINDITD